MLMRAGVVIHLEHDTVPSPDARRYFDWTVHEIPILELKSKDGHQITLASGYHKPGKQAGPEQSHLCNTRPTRSSIDAKRGTCRVAPPVPPQPSWSAR